MSDDQGYNGWCNYETWCVSLWLSNDEGTYNATRELAVECGTGVEGEKYDLADALKAFVEDLPEVVAVQEGPASFVVDLLGAALSAVSWVEIAENLLSEQ